MTKKQLLDACAKAARSAKVKSYVLAAAGGLITSLMYREGYIHGAADTGYKLGVATPDEVFDEESEAETTK